MYKAGKFPIILPLLAGLATLTACSSGYNTSESDTLGVPRDGRGEPILADTPASVMPNN